MDENPISVYWTAWTGNATLLCSILQHSGCLPSFLPSSPLQAEWQSMTNTTSDLTSNTRKRTRNMLRVLVFLYP